MVIVFDTFGIKIILKKIPTLNKHHFSVKKKREITEEKNVEIFYISNRYSEQLDATVNNLKKLGFPDAKKSNVLLRGDTRSKSERRKSVSDNYEIIMLIGDNLSDFNDEFEIKLYNERSNQTDKLKNEFGTKLIVLPNPNYGDWESNGLFGGISFDNFQKDSIRKSKIKSY